MDGNSLVQVIDRTELNYGGVEIEWILTPMGRKAAKAQDVVKALGKSPSDTSRLVNQHVFADYRFQASFGAAGRPSNYLYEQGVVQLATRIDSLEAEPFQRWVFETVVKIFASGGYISPTATSAQLDGLMEEIRDLKELNDWLVESTKRAHRITQTMSLYQLAEGFFELYPDLGDPLRNLQTFVSWCWENRGVLLQRDLTTVDKNAGGNDFYYVEPQRNQGVVVDRAIVIAWLLSQYAFDCVPDHRRTTFLFSVYERFDYRGQFPQRREPDDDYPPGKGQIHSLPIKVNRFGNPLYVYG
jgi:prophage antirepressor-like protein